MKLNCHNWWVFMASVRKKIPHIVISHWFLHSMHSVAFLCESDFFFYYQESESLWATPWTITFSSELMKVREKITKILNYIIFTDFIDHVMEEFIQIQQKFYSFKDKTMDTFRKLKIKSKTLLWCIEWNSTEVWMT